MVAKNKRIRTAVLTGVGAHIAGGVALEYPTMAQFTAQGKILIVGAEVECEVQTTGDTSFDAAASMAWAAELSRNALREQPGQVVSIGYRVGSLTMGSPASHGSNLDVNKNGRVMFPEGYGVEMDDGETINLHAWFDNSSADAGGPIARGTIYYIEQ